MKVRILILFLLFVVMVVSPVLAIYCTGCGNKAADDAKFCSQCGKAFTQGFETIVETVVVKDDVSASSYPIIVTSPTPQAFQVTTQYLLFNGYRIYKNGFFWVAEISGNRARIWSVNEAPYNELIMGWVSLAELEKRSTFILANGVSCVEPPPPTAKVVVVEHRNYWQRWGFFSGGHRRHPHGKHGGHRRH